MKKNARQATKDKRRIRAAIENYSHIWYHPDLTVDMKAGFLAACCDSRRCFLAQLGLHERVHTIRVALIEEGIS